MLVIYVNSRLNCRSGGEGREPLLSSSSLPYSPLLRLSLEFFHSLQENRDSKEDRSWEYIKRSEIYECRFLEQGRTVSFLGIYVSNWCTFSVGGFLFQFAGL
jgi:hypothetical protein